MIVACAHVAQDQVAVATIEGQVIFLNLEAKQTMGEPIPFQHSISLASSSASKNLFVASSVGKLSLFDKESRRELFPQN